MPKIILVRHAESEANVGIHHDHGPTTKLTENGVQQATELCTLLDPSFKVISSHFHRAQHTAQLAAYNFHNNEIDTWEEVGEFLDVNHLPLLDADLNLSPTQKNQSIVNKNNTDPENRMRLEFFWDKLDPYYKFNGNDECFKDFADRAREAILKLQKLTENTYIFSHGYLIRIIRLYLRDYSNWSEIKSSFSDEREFYTKLMRDFLSYYLGHEAEPRTDNCGQVDISEKVREFNG